MGMIFKDVWFQKEAVWSLFNFFETGRKGHPVVAMPTGTGKSVVIADFTTQLLKKYPHSRVMMLTHVKQLIAQNGERLQQFWPQAPLGIYSAGLNSRDKMAPIIFGGVKSVANEFKRFYKELDETGVMLEIPPFGIVHVLVIDECHLLSAEEESEYQFVISCLRKLNPNLRVVGFTATPYRMRMGKITENGIFTEIVYDVTDFRSYNRLIAEGYLCPAIVRRTDTYIDYSNVGIRAGELNQSQLNKVTDKEEIVFSACREMIANAYDRNCWLIFGQGIDNCEHIAATMQYYGVEVHAVHTKKKEKVNDDLIKAFKAGEIRGLVNDGKLTTGFDHQPIDYIGNLRATLSPGLWVQMVGRGTRVHPSKQNLLVDDFARNTLRVGAVNDPKIPRKPGGGGGDAPVWECPACKAYNHASARECEYCGEEHVFKSKLFATAGEIEILRSEEVIVEYFDVTKALYFKHQKTDKNRNPTAAPCIKVLYVCGLLSFTHWVHLEAKGLPGHKAREWWRQSHSEEPPMTVDEALRKQVELRTPKRIRVHVNKQYPEVLSIEY